MGSRFRLFGVLAAVVAYVVTLTLPLYETATETSTDGGLVTSESGRTTLIEVNGWGAAVPGLILVLLAVVVWQARYVLLRWIPLGLFLLLTALMMLSIGMFFLPAALLLILGISLDSGSEDATG